MPKTRKMKWGMLLTAGLALAASLVVAPLGAYAADVPTPELKDTYELEIRYMLVARLQEGMCCTGTHLKNGSIY